MSRVTPELLASCLSEVRSGRMTIAECGEAHPEVGGELLRLLTTATKLRPQLRFEPEPAFKLRARAELLEAISAEKESASRSVHGRLEGWLSPFRRDPSRLATLRLSMPALVVVLVIVLTGVAGGGATFASQSALPSDTLYPVKITVEGLQVRLIPGEAHKAEALVVCAERRLDEAQRSVEMGRADDFASAMEAYSRCLTLAEESLSRADASGHEVIEVATRLSAQLASQHERLAAAEARAPKEDRATWSRALEDSNRGMDAAISIADRKERPEDSREEAPAIPPTRTATPPPGGTSTRGGDEGESRPTPVTAAPGVLETKLAQALSDVQKLKDDPAVSGDNYKGLQANLLAAREAVDRGRNNAALNELGAFLGLLNAMQQSGHISAGSYDLLYSDYTSLVSSLGGMPGPIAELIRPTPTSGPREDSPQPKAGSGDDQDRRGTTPTAGPERTPTPGSRVSPTPEGRPDGRLTDPNDKATPSPGPVRAVKPIPIPTSQDDSRGRPDGRGNNPPQPTPAASPTQPSQDDSRGRPDGRGNNPPQPAPAASPTQPSPDDSRSRPDGRGSNPPQATPTASPTQPSPDDSRSRPDGRGNNPPQPAPASSPTQPSRDDPRSRPDGRGDNLPQPTPASTPLQRDEDDSRSRADGRGGNSPQPTPASSPTQPSRDDSRSRPDGRDDNLPQPTPASTPIQRGEGDPRSRADGSDEGSPKPTPASTPTRIPSSPTARPEPDETSRPGAPIPPVSPTQAPPSATPRPDSDGDKRPAATPDPTQRSVQASPSPVPSTQTPTRTQAERDTSGVLTPTPRPVPTRIVR